MAGRVHRFRGELRAREPQRQRERDEPLLGAVVQVALDPPPGRVARLDEPRAGGRQLLARVGAGECEADQLREVARAAAPTSAGRGSSPLVVTTTAPHSAPATVIGAATAERYPNVRICSAISPTTSP